MKKKRIDLTLITVLLGALLIVCGNGPKTISVAEQFPEGGVIVCMGDSITYGSGVRDTRDTDSYPAILDSLLEESWVVINDGKPRTTLQDETDFPYTATEEYEKAINTDAQVFLIMLGTNDTKDVNWNQERYETELGNFIDILKEKHPDAVLYLMTPPQAFLVEGEKEILFQTNQQILASELQESMKDVAKEKNIGLIDLFSETQNHPEWFSDGVHPNRWGNEAIAEQIYHVIGDD